MNLRWSLEHGMMVRRLGDGPEVVWLHGLGEWSVIFDAIVRHSALSGFTHTLPDLPGCGRSPWPEAAGLASERGRAAGPACATDSLAALAARLAEWLARNPPSVVVGHSMGGVLATLVAELIEVRGVVDVEGNLSSGDCVFSALAARQTAEDFVAHGFDAMRAEVYDRGAADPALRLYHGALCVASPAVFHRNATDLVALSVAGTLAPRLAALSVPALYVAGMDGGICAHSRDLLGRHAVEWVGLTPAGHWAFVDQPDAFAVAVARFSSEGATRT